MRKKNTDNNIEDAHQNASSKNNASPPTSTPSNSKNDKDKIRFFNEIYKVHKQDYLPKEPPAKRSLFKDVILKRFKPKK